LILPVGRKLPKSGLYIPESATTNKDLDWRRPRTIWTADGEIQVPTKRRPSRGRYQSVLRARVRNIWVKDEHGKLLVWDPHGSLNTITGGAGWDILNALFGYSGMPSTATTYYPYASGVAANSPAFGPAYNDGTYNFPTLGQIGNWYNGTDTYYLGFDQIRPYIALFGQVWYLHGASGGLTGSHIAAAVTPQMGHANSSATYLQAGYFSVGGWLANLNSSENPTIDMLSPDTAASDAISFGASGTPYIEHSITVGTTTSAQSVTFDSVAWVPIVGLGANSGTSSSYDGAGTYWAAGSPVTTPPTWASGSTTPSSISNLQVSALWVIGFAVTLSPGQSFGYTYTFQG